MIAACLGHGCGDADARSDAALDGGTSATDGGPAARDARIPTDDGPPTDHDAAPAPTCAPAQLVSECGSRAVIRATAQLPDGAEPASGTLVTGLLHRRLGDGSMIGVPHTVEARPDVTMTPGDAIDLELDFCAGGEMWSEENCDFVLFAFVDMDGDTRPTDGEPLGSRTIEVSCRATESPCYALVLDCLDCSGPPPAGGCTCAGSCAGVASPARIVTCLP